jgi:TRAP-type C4-dicarboxylate transport system permease small subunit
MKRILSSFNRCAYQVCSFLTNLLLAVLVVNNLAEMTARAFFETSLSWVFEVNVLLAVWLYFIAIYQVYFRRADISVDVLMRRAPVWLRRAVAGGIDFAVVVVLAAMAWQSWRLLLVQLPYKTPGLALPNALFTLPLLIGSVLMALTILQKLVAGGEEEQAGVA